MFRLTGWLHALWPLHCLLGCSNISVDMFLKQWKSVTWVDHCRPYYERWTPEGQEIVINCHSEVVLVQRLLSIKLIHLSEFWRLRPDGPFLGVHLSRHPSARRHVPCRGATPLFIAAQNGHQQCIDALLKGGASVDLAKNDGPGALEDGGGRLAVRSGMETVSTGERWLVCLVCWTCLGALHGAGGARFTWIC